MCGGICISQCSSKNTPEGNPGRFAALRPSILYNLGRVISYTVIGGIIGAVGSVVSFSGPMRGIVQIIAGIFMVIMGINMLNLFPWLRRFNPRMPKIFARKINAGKRNRGPFYIGLLNGLMPCGPLQAMQLYALSTGSPLTGALSMFLFSVGTVPLMFLFGAISSFLSKKFTGKMMTVSAVLVVVLGVFMFTNGASLSGIAIPTIPSVTSSAAAKNSSTQNIAAVSNGVQTVTSKLTSGSYEPITVQKGIPVKWTLQAPAGSVNGCNGSIVIPKFNVTADLKTGDNVIEFTPTESGAVAFSCWMGMIRSKIYVVDDLSTYDGSQVPADAAGGGDEGLPSCCGGGGYGGGYGSGSTGSSGINNLLIPDVPTDQVGVAQVKDGVQSIDISFDDKGFSPAVIVMQKGLQTNWNIIGKSGSDNQTNVLFPLYYAQIAMKEGDNKISLIPDQDFEFYTQDGKFAGFVKVVDDISKVDINAIQDEVKANNTKS
jgi:sulfite exporter TauE/SafE